MTDIPRYLTVIDLADRLQLRPETIRYAIHSGELEAVRIGTRYRIAPAAAKAWIDGCAAGYTPAALPVPSLRASSAKTYAFGKVES